MTRGRANQRREAWRDDRREDGFALMAVIWFVALSALVAVVIAGWMTRSLDLAARLQDRLLAHRAIISAQNEVAFRMTAGFFSLRGIELPQGREREQAMVPGAGLDYTHASETHYLGLDARPYKLGSVVVRLQDEAGLLTLVHPDTLLLGGLLRHYGIRYEDRGVLTNRLLDYMDKSTLYRLNGATAADYLKAGRAAPRAAPLLTPWEASRVLSWDDYPALWRGPDPLPDLTAVGDSTTLNPNTAPKEILRSLPGMDEAAAERVVKYRKRFIIESSIDLDRAAGVAIPIDPFELRFFPSGNLLVTLVAANDPLVHRLALRQTPIGLAPYRIDYAVNLPANDRSRAAAAAADLTEAPDPYENRSTDAGLR